MPQKLGQHFLTDAGVLQRIAEALDIRSDDIVFEIGPGHGELTSELIKHRPARLILIEKDPRLAEGLEKQFNAPNLSIYRGDVRRDLASLVKETVPEGGEYKVAGNIPYYLTGYLLRLLSEMPVQPSRTVLTVQKEVAERLSAQAPHMNRLAASVGGWADAEMLMTIPAGAFSPPPKVSSTVVRLIPRQQSADAASYFPLVRRLFAQPRKTIGNNLLTKDLSADERAKIQSALASLGIDPGRRAQELDIPTLHALAKTLGA